MPILFVLFAIAAMRLGREIRDSAPPFAHAFMRRPAGFMPALFLAATFLAVNSEGSPNTLLHWLRMRAPFDEVEENKSKISVGKHLEQILTPRAKVALVWAGTVPYFFEREYVDILGKNDPVIAKLPMRRFDRSRPSTRDI
jgi:hypothetical protein